MTHDDPQAAAHEKVSPALKNASEPFSFIYLADGSTIENPLSTSRRLAENREATWRASNAITDDELVELQVLLCDNSPRDLALNLVRSRAQNETPIPEIATVELSAFHHCTLVSFHRELTPTEFEAFRKKLMELFS